MRITLCSWNIWQGRHIDAAIKTLQKINPDIIALQEVTVREKDGEVINDAETIAHALSMQFVYAKAFHTDRHFPVYDLGNAIVSKFPIASHTVVMLSDLSTYQRNSTTEPRNAVIATIQASHTPLTVVSTHLGYDDSLGEGKLQRSQVNTLISALPANNTILAGDFNSEPNSAVIKQLETVLQHAVSDLTPISWTNMKKDDHPQHRIDYIFKTADIDIQRFQIGQSEASDHLPLIVELEI